nr:FecR family protein [uncultured Bacteroides sp.]
MTTNLLQKYIIGDATLDEKEQVVYWIEASQENMREYMALRKMYDIQIWHNSDIKKRQQEPVEKRHLIRTICWEAIKISAVFALAFVIFQQIKSPAKEEFQSCYVPEGQRAELQLPDGTKVWLNAKSRLTYPTDFNGKNRKVTLTGEGYFAVARNEKKPFIVHAQQYDIRVLGTEFNVIAYPHSNFFETSLLKGSVQIFTPNSGTHKLVPNRRIYSQKGKLYEGPIKNSDHFLWRKGLICFNDESVGDIIKKLEIYYDITIIVKNRSILDNRYSGKFRMKEGVEHVLKVLQLKHKFSYEKDEEKNTITIL